ncbi:retrovirus-related pol polyprotein from transposon TNT 1-94 [Tanacetum coccineum]
MFWTWRDASRLDEEPHRQNDEKEPAVEEARIEKPLDNALANAYFYTKRSQELLEYVTCLEEFGKRDTKVAPTPLNRKKQVTFKETYETSNNNTQKHVEQQKVPKTNVLVILSTVVISSTKASGSKPRSVPKNSRNLPAKSDNKEKVEDHPKNNKSNLKQENHIDSSISYKRIVINSNSNSACKTLKKVLSKVKQVWKATGKLFTNVGYQWKPTRKKFTLGEQCLLTRTPIEIGDPTFQTLHLRLFSNAGRIDHPWYLDSGCSKHMMGNRSRLKNFMKKFIGTVRFRNYHFGAIMGYGDYVIGDSVISRIYYVEELRHNLFSVGQFYDSDLEVTFRKHSCYVRNEDGVDLLKASKNKSWLWHRRLNHLNFGTINDLARKDLRTPQQNDVVERRNHMLMEAARTMMIFSKALIEDLGKLKATADIGIFIDYAPNRKGYRIYNKITRRIMETIHIQFDELSEPMFPVHISSRPEPVLLTPGQISSGLVLNLVPAAPYVRPYQSKIVPFQCSTVFRSTTPFISILQEPSSKESSSRDGCSTKSNQVIQPYNHLGKWLKDYLMDNVIVKLDEYGDVLKNMPRLVAKGYHQEEGINFEESFAPVPRAWYNTLSRFLLANKFSKGVVDPTYQAKPTKKHLEAIKRVLRFLPWRESFGGDNDEELEMEPRPERTREVTLPLRTRSPRVHRQRERVVGFEEAPNREISRIGRNVEGNGPSEAGAEENGRREMNFPLLLVAHLGRNEDGQPSRSSLTSIRLVISLLEEPLPTLHKEDPTGSVTSFFHWIEDYPLPDGLKMPSHVGSYDVKGDHDNFLHLFEGAICLHEDQCISGFVHDLKARNLVEHLSTNLPSTYKGLMEKTYTWIEAREVSINGAPNDQRDNFKRSRKPSWNNGRGQRSRDRFSPYQGPNHGLLSSLSKSPREILATKKVAKTFEQPPWLPEKERKKAKPAETYVLMISRISCNPRKRYAEEDYNKVGEITFPLVTKDESSADPVIIKAYVSKRQVNRVYMDSGSSCEVIYEHCFLKLKPSIRSLRVDSKTPLVGLSREYSWPLGEDHHATNGDRGNHYPWSYKFPYSKRIGTLLFENSLQGPEKEQKIASEAQQADKEDILSYVDAKKKIMVNNQYLE